MTQEQTMIIYRMIFGWLISLVLNFFSPAPLDASMLNSDHAPAVAEDHLEYNDDPKRNRRPVS